MTRKNGKPTTRRKNNAIRAKTIQMRRKKFWGFFPIAESMAGRCCTGRIRQETWWLGPDSLIMQNLLSVSGTVARVRILSQMSRVTSLSLSFFIELNFFFLLSGLWLVSLQKRKWRVIDKIVEKLVERNTFQISHQMLKLFIIFQINSRSIKRHSVKKKFNLKKN